MSCTVAPPHWINAPPDLPVAAHVRLRYRHPGTPATLKKCRDGSVSVHFSSPQDAPTPGQGAVFYMGDEVLGAGIIAS
jgi:tRNA-specific 2-thiouridylase